MENPNKVLGKVVHLYAGLDLIGSKTSLTHRESEIEVTPVGLRITSKKTQRVILLPWSNVKGVELLTENEGVAGKKSTASKIGKGTT